MRRRLFKIVTVASMALCVLTVGLWTASQWYFCEVIYRRTVNPSPDLRCSRTFALCAWPDVILFDTGRESYRPPAWIRYIEQTDHSARVSRGMSFLGVAVDGGFKGTQEDIFELNVTLPYWLLVALTAVLPALWTFSALRARRTSVYPSCRFCGYDLRATPDRCPECGAATESGTQSAAV